MIRRVTLWLVLLAVVSAAAYAIFTVYLGVSTVNVALGQAPEGTLVYIDDRRLAKSSDNGDYTTKVKAGRHQLYIISPGDQDASVDFRTLFRSTVSLSPDLQPTTAESVAKDLLNEGNPLPEESVSNAKLYGPDKNWLVFYSGVAGSDGAINVAKFLPEQYKWEVIASGTTIYLREYLYEAPTELIKDIEAVLED